MQLRAIAFHESISVQRLEALFQSDQSVFAGTIACQCSKCGTHFAVFFPLRDDHENEHYLAILEKAIANHCDKGKHQPEYPLNG